MDMISKTFFPALLMILFYVFIGVSISRASKKKKQDSAPPPGGGENPGKEHPPERKKTLAGPLETAPHPEKDLYRGSLGVVTDEGYDPCHEEQMRSMPGPSLQETATEPAAGRSPAMPGWTQNDIVRGFIVSEVLNRKRR